MRYVKASAEIIALENIDTITASQVTPNTPVADLLELDDATLRQILGSENDFIAKMRRFFGGSDAVEDAVDANMTVGEARQHIKDVHARCAQQLLSLSESYSSEEEDDSFDSEW